MSPRKIFPVFALLAFASAFLLVARIYKTQENTILRASPLPTNYKYSDEGNPDELFLSLPSGEKINALRFFSKESKGTILFLHGRGMNLAKPWSKRLEAFIKHGYDVLIIDYRGFGKSLGSPSEQTLLEDADAAYQFLKTHYRDDEIILYGQSLGTGPATYLGTKYTPKLIILEAPYYSIFELACQDKSYLPPFLIQKLLKYPLRVDKWISKVNSPIEIFHGTEDEIVPFDSSFRLMERVKEEVSVHFTPIEGWGHKRIFHHLDYLDRLAEVL